MRLVFVVLLSWCCIDPAFCQPQAHPDAPASAGQRMQIMIGSLAGENAELAARLDHAVRENAALRKELEDTKKATAEKPVSPTPSAD